MTTISKRISLDQYPSEEDLGLRPPAPLEESSHDSPPTLLSYDVEAIAPTADEYLDEDYVEQTADEEPYAYDQGEHAFENAGLRTDPTDVESPRAFDMGDTNPHRLADRGLAFVIFGSAAVIACIVVGIIWVTLDPASTPATEAAQAFEPTP